MSASRTLVEHALIRTGAFEHFTSAPILYELGDVLSRDGTPPNHANAVDFVTLVANASHLVTSVQCIVIGCRDPRDDKVLECAMNAPAQYIVTRDMDLLDASPREKYAVEKIGIGIRQEPIRIVSIEPFLYDVLAYERPRTAR